METFNHRRQISDARESNAKVNDTFATKMVSTEMLKGKDLVFKKVEEVTWKSQISLFF